MECESVAVTDAMKLILCCVFKKDYSTYYSIYYYISTVTSCQGSDCIAGYIIMDNSRSHMVLYLSLGQLRDKTHGLPQNYPPARTSEIPEHVLLVAP